MSKGVKDLSEILPPELRESEAFSLDEYIGKPLIIHAAREVTGTHGAYMRICVSDLDDEAQFYVATGASQPMEVLNWSKENRSFPFTAQFVRAGKAILLKGVK